MINTIDILDMIDIIDTIHIYIYMIDTISTRYKIDAIGYNRYDKYN